MNLGSSDAGNDPTSLTTRRAYDLLAEGFGKGVNGPLVVAAQLSKAGDKAAQAQIGTALRTTPDVAAVAPPRVAPNGQTVVYTVYPRSAPQDQATTDMSRTCATTGCRRSSARLARPCSSAAPTGRRST